MSQMANSRLRCFRLYRASLLRPLQQGGVLSSVVFSPLCVLQAAEPTCRCHSQLRLPFHGVCDVFSYLRRAGQHSPGTVCVPDRSERTSGPVHGGVRNDPEQMSRFSGNPKKQQAAAGNSVEGLLMYIYERGLESREHRRLYLGLTQRYWSLQAGLYEYLDNST